jgi:hypothetical protein
LDIQITELTHSGVKRATMESSFEEIRRLRRAMRDVAAISALPNNWLNYDRVRVADSLAGALVRMLGLRFVYVCFGRPADGDQLEVAYTPEGAASAELARQVRERLGPWIDAGAPLADHFSGPLASEAVRLSVVSLGSLGESGLLVAASERPDFPSEEERLSL